jgi:hypothetical protein
MRLLPLVLVFASCASFASAARLVDLSFDSPATLDIRARQPDGTNTYHFLNEDGQSYDMPHAGDYVNPSFSSSVVYRSGGRSLVLKVSPSTTTDNERSELRAIHGEDANGLRFGQTRYFGYAFRIDGGVSQRPTDWLHLTQVWQRKSGTLPDTLNKVPFTMSIKGGQSNWQLEAVARAANYPQKTLTISGSNVIATNTWHTLVYRFSPNHHNQSGSGRIQVWLNGTLKIDWTGDWGTIPQTVDGGSVLDQFDIRCGIYRASENTTQQFYFDNVRVGEAYSEVTP